MSFDSFMSLLRGAVAELSWSESISDADLSRSAGTEESRAALRGYYLAVRLEVAEKAMASDDPAIRAIGFDTYHEIMHQRVVSAAG